MRRLFYTKIGLSFLFIQQVRINFVEAVIKQERVYTFMHHSALQLLFGDLHGISVIKT